MTTPAARQVFSIVFAVVFAVVYVIAVEQNYALFTYHPLSYEFGFGVQEARDGPAMYWFGWMATAGVAAAVVALAACALPQRATQLIPPAFAWAVPLAVIIAFGILLRDYFLR